MNTTRTIGRRLLALFFSLIMSISCLCAFATNASATVSFTPFDQFYDSTTAAILWSNCKTYCNLSGSARQGSIIKYEATCYGNSKDIVYTFDLGTPAFTTWLQKSLLVDTPSFKFVNSKVTQTYVKATSSKKTKTKSGYGKWLVCVYKLKSKNPADGYSDCDKYIIQSSSKTIKLEKNSSCTYYRIVMHYLGNTCKKPSGYLTKGDPSTAKLDEKSWTNCWPTILKKSFV